MKTVRVLIVEDSSDDAFVMTQELHQAGWDVTAERVETEEEMRRALAQSSWDVVLADYRLPRYRASLALALLHELEIDVPFVIVSGAIGEATVVELMRQGAHNFVSKDNIERLPQIVERELDASKERAELQRTQQALSRSRESLRNLAARLQTVREEERTSLAREVHDDLGQSLVGLKYLLAQVVADCAAAPTVVSDRLRDAMARIDALIDYGRQLSMRLRPSVLDELGLDAAVAWQVREFSAQSGVEGVVTIGEFEPADPAQAIAVFRILQEALLNVSRHARASRVEVVLETTDGRLMLRVADDGRGITEQEATSPFAVGLVGMRERAEAFGGSVDIRTGANGGTSVELTMPSES